MRKIVSKQEESKKRKRNQLIMGLILIFVMFFSVLGYSFGGSTKTNRAVENSDNFNRIVYNGFGFENQNGLWVLNTGNFIFAFTYNPEQIEEIYTDVNTLNNYYQKPLYISSENTEAETEILRNIGQIALRTQLACLEWQNCADKNLPVKTCADNFIIIKEDNLSYIVQEDNCVFINGPKENLVRLADQFLFKAIGIT